jgi:hypothetical protein
MHKYKDAPDWLHYPANISKDELRLIQKELAKLFVLTMPEIGSGFIMNDVSMVPKICPRLTEFLKRNKLFDILSYIVTIVVHPKKEFLVHVDGWESIGLNFPILNCEDSYTVWYDTEILDQPTHDRTGEIEASTKVCDQSNLEQKEIGRLDATIPSWLNVNIPHRPVVYHNKLRAAISLRFNPAPTVNGELWPHLIKSADSL